VLPGEGPIADLEGQRGLFRVSGGHVGGCPCLGMPAHHAPGVTQAESPCIPGQHRPKNLQDLSVSKARGVSGKGQDGDSRKEIVIHLEPAGLRELNHPAIWVKQGTDPACEHTRARVPNQVAPGCGQSQEERAVG